MTTPRAAAHASIHGLALGDAFGQRWFLPGRTPEQALSQIRARHIPEEPVWRWTDDTAMALAILRALHEDGEIHPDNLAAHFAATYQADPGRGYGYGMHELLPHLARDPASWRTRATQLFGGEGSLGNGAAMRTAPVGAWFHADLDHAIAQATLAARVTHAHPEGIAGAVAVTVAAALAARLTGPPPPAPDFLRQIADHTPTGAVHDGLLRAATLPDGTLPSQAAVVLGSGQRVRADDTVPFALWSAAHYLHDLTEALWTTAEGLGDIDTTCAITAGTVAVHTDPTAVPDTWRARCEPLPGWIDRAN